MIRLEVDVYGFLALSQCLYASHHCFLILYYFCLDKSETECYFIISIALYVYCYLFLEDSGRGSSIPPTASPLSVQVITADKLTNQKTDGSPVNDRKTNASPVNDRKMNGSPVSEQQMNGSPGNERKTNGSPVSEQQMNGSPVNDRKVDDMLASGSREFPSLLPLASPKKSPSMSRLARLCVNQECMSDGKTALHVAIKVGLYHLVVANLLCAA